MTSNRSVSEMVERLHGVIQRGADVAVFLAGQRQTPSAPTKLQLDELGQFLSEARDTSMLALSALSSQAQSDDLLSDVIDKARDSRFSAEFIGNCLRAALGGGKVALLPTAIPVAVASDDVVEAAVQAALDAGVAVNGEHGVAAARIAARFVLAAIPPAGGVEERLREALLRTRNTLLLVGRDSPARTEALAEADALLEDYPPFVAMKNEMAALLAEWREKGWLDGAATLNESSARGGGDGR